MTPIKKSLNGETVEICAPDDPDLFGFAVEDSAYEYGETSISVIPASWSNGQIVPHNRDTIIEQPDFNADFWLGERFTTPMPIVGDIASGSQNSSPISNLDLFNLVNKLQEDMRLMRAELTDKQATIERLESRAQLNAHEERKIDINE